MNILLYTFTLITILLALAGIVFIVEVIRRAYHKSGDWAASTAAVLFFIWVGAGAVIRHNM